LYEFFSEGLLDERNMKKKVKLTSSEVKIYFCILFSSILFFLTCEKVNFTLFVLKVLGEILSKQTHMYGLDKVIKFSTCDFVGEESVKINVVDFQLYILISKVSENYSLKNTLTNH